MNFTLIIFLLVSGKPVATTSVPGFQGLDRCIQAQRVVEAMNVGAGCVCVVTGKVL